MPPSGKPTDRRSSGLLRVPFVQRCSLQFDDGKTASAFLVNINVLGAYVARDDLPLLGQAVTCSFRTPDNDSELILEGVVAWVNPHQQHPVHSLPPGFGIKFERLPPADLKRIERLVRTYVSRRPSVR